MPSGRRRHPLQRKERDRWRQHHDDNEGRLARVPDPYAVPFPEGPIWDRLGHELVYGRDPVRVAYDEYGESVEAVKELDDLFWGGYSRSCWLAEAEEYGILQEAVRLDNDALIARLEEERAEEAVPEVAGTQA